ncbi:hypothetical protein Celaphus_00015241 [Cervus elaphus hippelaphus]|uniref:Uncharacterized protein n=1 Tax=Cervus elaphus hippelaphus TaxID=46360 RepID=A0A212CRZ5_CEREH|nr:hypothetical protein Celaphus_00015241 [Cervus elaphus hippelaphus]
MQRLLQPCLGRIWGWAWQAFMQHRSTFCSIIAQLTEETQPLFETTLKSRAVSEDSDVRFTCIVTDALEAEAQLGRSWGKEALSRALGGMSSLLEMVRTRTVM